MGVDVRLRVDQREIALGVWGGAVPGPEPASGAASAPPPARPSSGAGAFRPAPAHGA